MDGDDLRVLALAQLQRACAGLVEVSRGGELLRENHITAAFRGSNFDIAYARKRHLVRHSQSMVRANVVQQQRRGQIAAKDDGTSLIVSRHDA